MIRFFTALVFLSIAGLVLQTPAWAYGGGGGSRSSCTKPYFSNEQPAQNAEVKAVSEVSFTATDNTATGTLAVKVNGQAVQLTVTPQSSGRFAVVGKLPQPVVQVGKVHIGVYGKSKDDCDNQLVYFVTVKPIN
ncbi:MAG TPA: hypothetical protein VI457_12885 [Methylococcaceae bacterium]|nr:hypothetical protein [Methylococcaceae bacterium]